MVFISILIIIVALAIPSFQKELSSILITRITSIIFIYAGVLSYNTLYIQEIGSGIGIYSGLFQITYISQLIEIFILILASLILMTWPLFNWDRGNFIFYLLKEKEININRLDITRNSTEYSLIVLFSTLGASLLISSSDLISMYLSIELQSFGVYILTTLYRENESATNAGLKYFLLGGLSSCFILLGSGLIYSFSGLTNLESIYTLLSTYDNNNIIQGINLGFILIFIGFLFKIGSAPLHNWAPDVYDDSPTIVTIWLTIMPKISILIFLLEIYTQINYNQDINLFIINSQYSENTLNIIKSLLLICSFLSLIIGTLLGLAQTKIKRLLAYSTISHIGFLLLALAINSEQSIDSFIFYIIQYSFTNLNTFLIILALGYLFKNSLSKQTIISPESNTTNLFNLDIKNINELKGLFFLNPILSVSLSISLFSMAGIPPLIGFFSKQFVLYSAMINGYYFMALLAIIVSIISASYYIKIIRILHTSINLNAGPRPSANTEDSENINIFKFNYLLNNNKNNNNNNNNNFIENIFILSNVHSFLISTLTLSILLFVLKPSIILNSTMLLSLSLFNF